MKRLLITLAAGLFAVTTAHAQLSNEQATTAFNELQDTFHRPHVQSVTYDPKTDSYFWIGPKHGKKMSLSRKEFDEEVSMPYLLAHQSIPSPTPAAKPADPGPTPTPVADPNDPWNKPEFKDLLKPQTDAQKAEEKASARKMLDAPSAMLSGPKPEVDGLWGVSLQVHNAIKRTLRDPESYKFLGVNGLYPDYRYGLHCWREDVAFRARNGFNGYTEGIAHVWVVGESEKVLGVTLEE
jgi:hypothetical protein